MAPVVLVVVVTAPPLAPFFTSPVRKVPGTPASLASVQPSPSESKSNWLDKPSLSVSQTSYKGSAEMETLAFCIGDAKPVFWNCKS